MSVQPLPEIRVYFAIHFLFVGYCIYIIYHHRSDIYWDRSGHGFDKGWAVLGPNAKRDSSDYEWTSWKQFLFKAWPFYLLHVILSNTARSFVSNKLIPFAAVSVSLAFLVIHYGGLMLIVLLGISLLYFKISSVKSKALIWSIAAVQLLVTNLLKTDHYLRLFQKWAGLNNADTMEVMIISAWCFLKCVSFSLEFINCSNEKQKFALMNFLHYVFYFPTLFLGPVMVYGRFSHHTSRSTTTTTLWIKLKKLTLDIGRLFIWGLFLELSLHYLYVNSLQNSVKIVNKMETPTLFGFAYLTGQYFHLKYVVGYGIGISVANFDGHQPPRTPICIARVHRFSDMWKYFDEGLYEFLFKYIYCAFSPKRGSRFQKIRGMCITFLFVYLWHGYFLFVFVWVIMNLLCLLLETSWIKFKLHAVYQQHVAMRLSENNQRRLDAVIGTQILLLAVISNFFFLASEEIGIAFLKRAYLGGFAHYFRYSLALVFMYFTSEHIRAKERKEKSINKQKS